MPDLALPLPNIFDKLRRDNDLWSGLELFGSIRLRLRFRLRIRVLSPHSPPFLVTSNSRLRFKLHGDILVHGVVLEVVFVH